MNHTSSERPFGAEKSSASSFIMNAQKQYYAFEDISQVRYDLDISNVFAKSWHKLSGFKLDFFLAMLLYSAIAGAAMYGIAMMMGFIVMMLYLGFMVGASNELMINPDLDFFTNPDELLIQGVIIFYSIYLLLLSIVSIPINIVGMGLIVMAQKRVNRLKVDLLKDLFMPFKLFWKLLFLQLSIGLLYIGGLILLILPGLYFMVASSLAIPLAFAYPQASIRALIVTSWKIVNQHFWKICLIYLLLIMMNIIAILPFGVGLIWSLPLSYLVMMEVLQCAIEVPVSDEGKIVSIIS